MKRIAQISLLVVLNLVFTVVLLVNTTGGLRVVVWSLQMVPSLHGLSVGAVHGRLWDHFVLENVEFNSRSAHHHIQTLSAKQNCKLDSCQISQWQLSGVSLNSAKYRILADQINLQGDLKSIGKSKLTLSWQKIISKSINYKMLVIKEGQLIYTGNKRHYTLQGFTYIAPPRAGFGKASLYGHGSGNTFQLDNLQFKLANSYAGVSGSIQWQPTLRWNLIAVGQQVNFAHYVADYPALVDFVVASEGEQNSKNPFLNLKINQFQGKYLNQPVAMKGALFWQNNNFKIDNFAATIGNAQLKLHGSLNQRWLFYWFIDIPNLKNLLPDAKGKFYSTGQLLGSRAEPVLQANSNGHHIKFLNLKIAQFDNKIDLPLNGRFHINLKAQHLAFDKYNIAFTDALIEGDKNQQSANLKINFTEQSQLTIKANSKVKAQKLSGEIAELNLRDAKLGHGHLQEPIHFTASLTDAAVQPFCWQLAGETLCADGLWQQDHVTFAHVRTESFSLHKLPNFIPYTEKLTGKLSGDLTFNFLPKQTSLQGEVNIEDGKLLIPSLNLKPDHITLHANADGQKINFNLTAQSGHGTAVMSGLTELDYPNFTTTATLTGQDVLISNTHEYRIAANPHLTMQYQQSDLSFNGEMLIPAARIHPMDFGDEVIELTDDAVWMKHDKVIARESALNLYTDITLQAGKDVKINIMGLNALLDGKVNINYAPNKPMTATGMLSINDGEYKYFGQSLKISKGANVTYTGGRFDDPGLNLVAVRQAMASSKVNNITGINNSSAALFTQSKKITVGINVQGTAKAPRITLFSEPAELSQADILAYLVLGHGSDSASPVDGKVLIAAASSLGIGGDKLKLGETLSSIRKKSGLDVIDVQTSTTTNLNSGAPTKTASLVVGKALSKHLYLNYTLGMAYENNNQNGENAWSNGVDLVYSFERD